MIAVIDYGVGNLFSLASSLRAIGRESVITSDENVIRNSDRILLPGVGAFGDAIAKLRSSGLDKVIIEETSNGKPILGVCLGMQLLFEKSYEYGEHNGLGLLKGSIVPMKGNIPLDLKIPHIGWNNLRFNKQHPLFKYINDGDFVYFVHSYYADGVGTSLLASTEYGIDMTAAVAEGNVMGTQFHPEKSGEVGLNILRGFADL